MNLQYTPHIDEAPESIGNTFPTDFLYSLGHKIRKEGTSPIENGSIQKTLKKAITSDVIKDGDRPDIAFSLVRAIKEKQPNRQPSSIAYIYSIDQNNQGYIHIVDGDILYSCDLSSKITTSATRNEDESEEDEDVYMTDEEMKEFESSSIKNQLDDTQDNLLEHLGNHSLYDTYGDRIKLTGYTDFPRSETEESVRLPEEVSSNMDLFRYDLRFDYDNDYLKSKPYLENIIHGLDKEGNPMSGVGKIDINNLPANEIIQKLMDNLAVYMKFEYVDKEEHNLRIANNGYTPHIDQCLKYGIGDCDKYAKILYMLRDYVKYEARSEKEHEYYRDELYNIYMIPAEYGGSNTNHARITIMMATVDDKGDPTIIYTHVDPTWHSKGETPSVHYENIHMDTNIRIAEWYFAAEEYGPASVYFNKTIKTAYKATKDTQKAKNHAQKKYNICIKKLNEKK